MTIKPKVALSQDFLLQLAKLSASVQSKVMKWAIAFQTNPASASIHYENIQGAAQSNLKSVRIDQDWRGIVFSPAVGDVYVLLHVDHHDAAYRWAERRRLTINPVTGAMQMVVVQELPVAAGDAASSKNEPQPPKVAWFAQLRDRTLMALGVPTEWIAAVREIASEAELDAMQSVLPVEAYEGLFLLAAGDTVEQILAARESGAEQAVDTQDFVTALEKPETLARFVVVPDDEAMQSIMNAPLAQWRVFLHPSQYKLANGDRSGPVRVLGGAGTGKTVLAMHRSNWLAQQRTAAGQKVLFTTFTKNLATDIEDNLKSLCNKDAIAKIEVRNLDAWVYGFMRANKFEHRIVYDRSSDAAALAWKAALALKDGSLGLSDAFCEQEFEQLVLAQGITTLDEYRMARRTGRGGVLSRAKRDALWPVFVEYRGQLASRKLKEVDDAYREVAAFLTAQRDAGKAVPNYSAIVVDETQDFGPQAMKLLRALIPPGANDLFLVGDGHQRIYSRNRAAMSRCGIDIRGRSKKLYLNYRTTEQIRTQALALLEDCDIDDLDDGQDESKRYKSLCHGPVPTIQKNLGIEQLLAAALAIYRAWQADFQNDATHSVCLICHSSSMRNTVKDYFAKAGVKSEVITANNRLSDPSTELYCATMHRAKGLEFDRVIVVAPDEWLGDPVETENWRKLLYVALTRAKREAALLLH
jgi:hypothetical protein